MEQAQLAEWVAGFVDGEGYIRASISEHDHHTIGYQARPSVEIKHSYIGGLIDAEGSLALAMGENDRFSVGYQAQPMVRVGMNENDQLINRLQTFAEAIGVDAGVSHNCGRDGRADTFVWRITNTGDVERFCQSIRGEVVVKKPEIEILLGKIIPLFRAGEHKRRRGFLQLVAWRDVMDSYKGGDRGKYNLEYFENLWDMKLERSRLPKYHPQKKECRQ